MYGIDYSEYMVSEQNIKEIAKGKLSELSFVSTVLREGKTLYVGGA